MSIDQLFRQANGECFGRLPSCRCANELGRAFKKGEDKEKAKEALIKLLAAEDKGIAAIALCFLSESFDEAVKNLSKNSKTMKRTRRLYLLLKQ